MQYIPFKETSLDGRTIRHYVLSPAGEVVCSTHTRFAAATLASIRNRHSDKVGGVSINELDWARLNGQAAAA
jgi:hypothetical protein